MSRHVRRRSFVALAAATLAPAAWAQSASDSALAEIEQRGPLRVGVTPA